LLTFLAELGGRVLFHSTFTSALLITPFHILISRSMMREYSPGVLATGRALAGQKIAHLLLAGGLGYFLPQARYDPRRRAGWR